MKVRRTARGRDSSRADPRQRRPSRRIALVSLALVGGAGVGYLTWRAFQTPPTITIAERTNQLDPEFVAMIERHVEAVRRAPRDARRRATLGLVYEANKMWPEARACYRNATVLQLEEPMWPHHAAIAWLEMGDIDGATAWMRQYAKRFPAFAPLQHRLGVTLLAAGEIEEAEAAFRTVIAQAPDKAEGYVGCGAAKLQAGDHAEAARILEKAVKLDPGYKSVRYLLGRAYRALGRLKDAERELTLGMGAKPRYLLDAWSAKLSKYAVGIGSQQDRAFKFLNAGKPAQAAAILEHLRKSRPDDVDALVNLGVAYLAMGSLEKAQDSLLRAAALDSTRFETYINLAACYRRLRRLVEALSYADRAVSLSPNAAQPHHTRGIILMQIRENEQALESLTTAASFQTRDPKIQQDLANVCMRLGHWEKAIDHFQQLATLLPTRWEPQLGLARANLQLGLIDEAAAALDVGLRMAPNEPRLLALAGRLLELQGR